MKKKFFFLVFLAILGNAQSHRFIYEYSYVSDSTKQDSVTKKLMRLNITPDFSEFLPEKKAKVDSVALRNIALNQQFDVEFSANSNSTDSYTDYKTGITKIFAEIGIQDIEIPMSQKPKWNLSSETKKIGTYNCQKATTVFGGRNWTAWFTTSLPFQEGPYVFKGLPGMIVEMEDATKSHHYLLVGNHNSENTKSNRFLMRKNVILDEKKFTKEWKKFFEHPVPIFTQMQNRGVIFEDNSGFAATHSAEIERTKKELKSNNNPILLTLYR